MLVIIHDVGLVMQADGICLDIIEGKINVVGIIGEDVAEVLFQDIGHGRKLHLGGNLRFEFRGHVRDQPEFIIQVVVRLAVVRVLVNQGTTCTDCHDK